MVRRKVTDALGSLHGLIWSNIAASPSKKAFPEGSDERLNGDLSHNDGKDSSVVRDVQTASQRVGHVQRLDQVEVRTATAFTGAHAPTFLVTRSSDAMGHRQKSYETAAFPSLHSNGLATVYDDNRKVRVAPAEAKRHLLSLSLRTFAQHPLCRSSDSTNTNTP